jgi:hypothetical protein
MRTANTQEGTPRRRGLVAVTAALAAAATLLGQAGCVVHQAQEFVVPCAANGRAEHDFETTDAVTLARVSGWMVSPSAGRQPSRVQPVGVQFAGSVASVSCERPNASVAFLLAP